MTRALANVAFYVLIVAALVLVLWGRVVHDVSPALTPVPASSGEVSV